MRSLLLAAIFVRLLPLPHGGTIDPFGARSLMAVARDGTIAATVTIRGYLTRIVEWDRGDKPRVLGNGEIAAFRSDGVLLANTGVPVAFYGARASAIDLRACEDLPQMSTGPVVAGALTDGSIMLTMRSPALVDLDDVQGHSAPVVLHSRGAQCLNAANGIALATAGLYTAGYTAFINGVPSPSNVVASKERFVAMRWHDRTPQSLGEGVAVAVSSTGSSAGADVPPGLGATFAIQPHARFWNASRAMTQIASDRTLSVAYAIDDRDRVAGMLVDAQGRHRAFLWNAGRLQLLDDRAPDGWRFECAYAFTPAGGLVGTGTYRGTPSAFEIDGL